MAESLFLISLVIVGGWILYEDLKKNRIRNHFLIILVLVGIFLNYYTGALTGNFTLFIINLCFAILVGLIIWFAGLWSAADAKCYISLVVLFPINWYRVSLGYFPGFAILINSSLPLFLFLVGQVLIQTNWEEKAQAAKKVIKPPFLANVLGISMGIVLLRGIISDFFKIDLNYFLILPLFLGLFYLIGKLKIKVISFFIPIIIFSFIFFPHLIGLRFFATVSIFSLLILLASLIIFLSQPLFTREVKISKLKEGMILSEMVLRKNQQFIKQSMPFLTFLSSLFGRIKSKPVFGYNPDGLKKNEVEELQQLEQDGYLNFDSIKVAETFPLTPALLLGMLITYSLKGSFLEII